MRRRVSCVKRGLGRAFLFLSISQKARYTVTLLPTAYLLVRVRRDRVHVEGPRQVAPRDEGHGGERLQPGQRVAYLSIYV